MASNKLSHHAAASHLHSRSVQGAGIAGDLAAAAVAATRPAPNHRILKKLGFGKDSKPHKHAAASDKHSRKSSKPARIPVEAERVVLPLSQAIAISPDDEVLLAIQRGQQNAAANLEGPSSKRLATKFSAAQLAHAAQGEPQVIGTYQDAQFVWTGEHRLSENKDLPGADSLPTTPTRRTPTPSSDASPSKPARPQVKLQIPGNNARGLPTSLPVLLTHSKSDFAEYGYISPVSDGEDDTLGLDDALHPLERGASTASKLVAGSEHGTFFTDSEESSPVSESSRDDFDVKYQSSETSPSSQESLDKIRATLRASATSFDEADEARDEVKSLKPVPLKRSATSSKPRTHHSNVPLPPRRASTEIDELIEEVRRYSMSSYHIPDIAISSNDAEKVIIKIFEGCAGLRDLFSLAMINRGFYKVFKQHELYLMQRVLRNESPPAWELRMSTQQPYTAKTFVQYIKTDTLIITELKSLIIGRCKSYLRPETIAGLHARDTVTSAKVDDAMWRIWSFCHLFGNESNREEDIVAQCDWLRGGVDRRSNQRQSAITAAASKVRPSSICPYPRHFGRGNASEGLNADQLFDMTEMWNCLQALLGGILGVGRAQLARQYMVFNNKGMLPEEGKPDEEDKLLEEWVHYLLTLGPAVVLDLAAKAEAPSNDVFKLAREMGWSKWSLLSSGASRHTFFKEAVTRVYKERAPQSASPLDPASAKEAQSQLQRRRTRHKVLATELKQKRAQGDFDHVPFTTEERPMSLWLNYQEERKSEEAPEPVPALPDLPVTPAATSYKITDFCDTLPQFDGMFPEEAVGDVSSPGSAAASTSLQRRRTHSSYSYLPSQYNGGGRPVIPRRDSSQPAHSHRTSMGRSSTIVGLTSVYNTANPASNTSDVDQSAIHPALRNSAPTPRRGTDASQGSEEPDQKNSVDKFVYNIVEMGFTPEDAKRALGATDNGHSLDVQRAIDWLLHGGARRATAP